MFPYLGAQRGTKDLPFMQIRKDYKEMRPKWPDLLHQFRPFHFHPPYEVWLTPHLGFAVWGWDWLQIRAYLLLEIRRGKEKVAIKASS